MAEKCEQCLRKTHFTIQCKCNKHLCIKHRDPDDHICTYNHQDEYKKLLAINNPQIKSKKIETI